MSGWNDLLIYATPSITALAIKAVIFWYGRRQIKTMNPWFLAFLVSMFGMTVTELASFAYANHPEDGLLVMIGAYLFLSATGITLLGLALDIGGYKHVSLTILLAALALTCIVLLVIPNAAIAGAKSIGYSITRVGGPYYNALQVVIVGMMLGSLTTLIYTARTGSEFIGRRRSLAMAIGVAPIVLTAFGVAAAMRLGLQVNAAVWGSVSVTFLMGVLVYTERETRLFNFLCWFPATEEHSSIITLRRIAFNTESTSLREARGKFDQLLIAKALNACGGNRSRTAQMLGVSRATLLRKLKGE
ncbi:hypothetical protein FKG94_17385 [Exilibacterium tricleocarpae]|uniref:DNA binding HTH domain-containing protein n=1 Tax=Exilibacterium tricleocarpae TaxID=2591008 RepID=A0A545T8D1_9GAMM|nr:helix-turn-helix domain-containing protein [Exilibacterium tricleocarpae]TQV73474.1 hypothetical protein FKG94_17385 [Exilibacterium tricleocarpae]